MSVVNCRTDNIQIVNGVKYQEYSVSFKFEGKKYEFSIWATSFEEALRRLEAIKTEGKVDGQILASYEATEPSLDIH